MWWYVLMKAKNYSILYSSAGSSRAIYYPGPGGKTFEIVRKRWFKLDAQHLLLNEWGTSFPECVSTTVVDKSSVAASLDVLLCPLSLSLSMYGLFRRAPFVLVALDVVVLVLFCACRPRHLFLPPLLSCCCSRAS